MKRNGILLTIVASIVLLLLIYTQSNNLNKAIIFTDESKPKSETYIDQQIILAKPEVESHTEQHPTNLLNTNLTPSVTNQKSNTCLSTLTEEQLIKRQHSQAVNFDKFILNADTKNAKVLSALTGMMNFTQDSDSDREKLSEVLPKRIIALSKLAEDYPDDKLINFQFLSACSNKPDHSKCSNEAIEKSIALDSNNGALWAVIANIYAANYNLEKTISAMEKAASSPVYGGYRKQH